MGTAYTKTSPTNFVDGETINASDFTTEFDAIDATFETGGHQHDGTDGEGGAIEKLLSNTITFGTGADTDIAVTFNANTADGVLTWMEDEDYFKFSDDVLVNSDEKLYFRDTAIYLNSSADGQLDIVADTEIQIAATTIDINGNVDISGTVTIGSAEISEAELEILDGATATTAELNYNDTGAAVGTVVASKTVTADANKDVASFRNITLTGELDGGSLDISGDADIDGTTNLDAVDIDGNVQLDGTFTVGVDDTGYDVKLFGATASAYMLWDASADDLILGGDAGLVVPDGQFSLGSTAVTTTAAEINLIDGGTSRGTTAVASGDGILINDAGTMRMTNVDTVSTYFSSHNVGGGNIVTTGALNSGSITSGFGTIDTGSSAITTTGLISGGSLDIDDVLINGTTIGHTDDTDLITLADGVVTVAGELDAATLDISGNADIDGTTNLDAVDIDGAVQIDGATTFGVDDTGVDVKFFGATSGAYLLWDESADKLLTAGGTVVDIVKDKLLIGGTAVTTTAAELNVLDAVTAGTVTASLGVVVDSNKDIGTFRNITLSGELDAGSLDVSGDIDVDGTSNLDAIDVDGAANFAADVTFADGADIITASAGTSNFRAGVNAGNSIESGGNYNVVIGDEAGTAITTGDNNTLIGYGAGDATTTVPNVNAFGYQALGANTTGQSLCAFGSNALDANTTANDNSAFGHHALGANTTGTLNNAFGSSSLIANTTGGSNTAVGHSALGSNTTASNNTAVGANALDACETTGQHTAMGHNALGACTDGTNNTAFGSQAGATLTTGSSNVFVGAYAGDAVTSGSTSVIIGQSAGTAMTTASENVIIGNNCAAALTTGGQSIYIGDNAAAAGALTGIRNVVVGDNAL